MTGTRLPSWSLKMSCHWQWPAIITATHWVHTSAGPLQTPFCPAEAVQKLKPGQRFHGKRGPPFKDPATCIARKTFLGASQFQHPGEWESKLQNGTQNKKSFCYLYMHVFFFFFLWLHMWKHMEKPRRTYPTNTCNQWPLTGSYQIREAVVKWYFNLICDILIVYKEQVS